MCDKNVFYSLRPLFHLLFQFVMLVILISALIWTCLKPNTPVYQLTSVYIPFLDSRNLTSHQENVIDATSAIFLGFEVSNPNKGMAIHFDPTDINIYFQDSVIGNKTLAGFYQGYKEITLFRERVYPLGHNFTSETFSGGTIRVLLRTAAEFKYKIFGAKKKHHQLDFEAYVPIGLDGRLSGTTSNVTFVALETNNKIPAGSRNSRN